MERRSKRSRWRRIKPRVKEEMEQKKKKVEEARVSFPTTSMVDGKLDSLNCHFWLRLRFIMKI